MGVYVSPGVYTREIDLSLYVPALSTTIVGMVGISSKGPTNVRTYVSNQQEMINVFGNPDSTIGYEVYAALQYLRRGRQLWFVRVVGAAAASSVATFSFDTAEAAEEIHAGLTAAGKNASSGAGLAGAADSGSVFSELGDDGIYPGSVVITITAESGTFEELEVTDPEGDGILTGTGTTINATGTIDYATGA